MLPFGPPEPTSLLFAGDTHNNDLPWKQVVLPAAHKHQVGGIVQLGDFGCWPLTGGGRGYLAWLSSEVDDSGLWIVLADGNREDHRALLQLAGRADGFVEVTARIRWAPRRLRCTCPGVRLRALGGVHPIDRQRRKLDSGRWGWFKKKRITPEQARRASAGGPTDVQITHDDPLGAQLRVRLEGVPKHSPGTQQSVRRLQVVADATKPKLLGRPLQVVHVTCTPFTGPHL